MTEELDETIPPQRADDNDYLRQLEMREATTEKGYRERKADGRFLVGDLIMRRYKVLSKLGQGGMGVVYKCFDETAGIEVALKALPPELSHDSQEMEDIKENFQLVHNLHHPNIASSNTLEKNPENGNYYLIMECCEGEDLRRWIKRKRRDNPLTLDDVLPIIKQVADALDYAHAQKIMHRDIKPGNIMIDSAGSVKVLDFGLAAQIHSSMSWGSIVYHGTSGTGPYMAPEQWRCRKQGAASDQYALAVMTYEMLSGDLPFASPDPAVLREAVLNETAEEIPDLPSAAQDALKRAMSKDPANRFKSCADFAAALGGVVVAASVPLSAPAEKVSPVELPQNDSDRLATLKKLIASGVFDDAAKLCDELLKENPEDGEVHYLNLLCQKKVTTGEGLLSVRDLPENKNFRLARCFAGPERKQELETLLTQWKAKTKKRKLRLRIIFSILAVLAVLLVAGGFFGIRYWQAKKAEEALEQMAKKAEEALEQMVKKAEEQGLILSDDKYTVVGVEDKNVGSIEIPDGIRYIGNEAFAGCRGLKSVTIPDSVRGIGYSAFNGCRSLTSVTIPEGVTDIRESTFCDCHSLTSITIPDSVTSIGKYAFQYSGLRSITIPDSVRGIGYSAFYDCTSLTGVTLGNSVTSIGGCAFSGCSKLTSITIPDSVTGIGGWAFSGCSKLTSITIPDSVTSIGDGAFSGCSKLTSITIPDSVKSIEYAAFRDCKNLTSITIPDSVTSIGACAFECCFSLTSISIPHHFTEATVKSWFGYEGIPAGCKIIRK